MLQQSVWHYGGGTLEQSAAIRYSSVVPAGRYKLSSRIINEHLYIYQQQLSADATQNTATTPSRERCLQAYWETLCNSKKKKLTKHERIIELIRHRDIILATIDYILKGIQNETPVPDHLEVIIEYYEQQKRQTEIYVQTKRLDRLQQKLIKLIRFPQGRGDLNFAAYVKEKTGYHIDIFESIRKRTDAVIAQNQVKNGKDLHDVAIFFTTYGHHPEYQAKLDTLKILVSDFGERTRKKSAS